MGSTRAVMHLLDGRSPNRDLRARHRVAAAALRDPDPNVRRHAVRLAADDPQSHRDRTLRDDLFDMTNDPDAGVRFQLALAIGPSNDPRASARWRRCSTGMIRRALRLAILCGIGQNPWPLMRELLEDADRARQHANFLEQVSEQFGSQASEKSLAECLDWMTADSTRSRNAGGLATLAGLSRGLFARGRSLRDPGLPVELLSKARHGWTTRNRADRRGARRGHEPIRGGSQPGPW